MAKKITAKWVNENLIGVSKFVKHKDGTMSFKRSYFYRCGMDADRWSLNVVNQLTEAGITVERVDAIDEFNHWPKTSFFTAVVREIVVDR